MSSGAARTGSARAGRAGHLSPLGRTLGENDGASRWKKTDGMARQRAEVASWASTMFLLTLVVSVGAVGARVGTRLRQFFDGKLLLQGRLAAWHETERQEKNWVWT